MSLGKEGKKLMDRHSLVESLDERWTMMAWDTCPAVERRPGLVSGAWVFTGTRVPLFALFENLQSGATIEEFLEWFEGVEKWQVKAVLEHEATSLRGVRIE